ncbi:iron-sulfur cluster assembly scaffold protein [Candidatus Bathycorpusculum sp.]|uniref:iron-sulfur cluster assembly scaffold protein n=1 Tax=Candidatus Bathycorpusculum sp. TaxID=2994959 RepID=UPI002817EF51|nr:iron-sulfur cluster assembly scaffold protein [Candidatus Termitimicrobium sp.]MCL2686567.1 iron-sulfur cluster assembly scaffold protein [Candidatus Termitimicrobium sp.]
MSRIPLPYNPKIMDLFRNPKNLGKMEDATVVAVAGNPACGDMITFYLKIDDTKQTIEKAQFESYGCAANIATSSIVTEMIKGLTIEQAWNNITWQKVTEEIGGLPSVKFHCGVLAVGALKRALRQYFTQKNIAAPSWLPQELTFEEKQALEEEELAKTLSKRQKPEAEK